MKRKKEKSREVQSLAQTIKKELVGNIIVMCIIALCSWALIFGSNGDVSGIGTYIGYVVCMIPFFTVVQTYVPFINKRAELVAGKWELKPDEKRVAGEPLLNIWSRILPQALLYGFGSMLLLAAVIYYFKWQPAPVIIVLVVLVINVINTTLLLKRYLFEDLITFAGTMSNGGHAAEIKRPLAGYLLVEHAIPFIILQGYINGCVANRTFFIEMMKADVGYVPLHTLLPDAFIGFIILVLIQWMFSNWLVRGDVQLHRISAEGLICLSCKKALGLILVAGAVVMFLYWAILSLGNVPGLTVGMAIVVKIAIVAIGIVSGAWLGINWGGFRSLHLPQSG